MATRMPAAGCLRLADRPATGGTPASVILTVQLEDLLAKAGMAETTDGTQLSAAQLLRVADDAEIWPTIIAVALIAREGGCSFPGCDHPPQWCDRHHILDWILSGPTDLNNMTLPLQISPHPLPAERLDVSQQLRRAAGMDTAALDRPRATTTTPHPNPTPPDPTPTRQTATSTSRRMTKHHLVAIWHPAGASLERHICLPLRPLLHLNHSSSRELRGRDHA
jgi:hypothetical protein